MLKQRVNHKQNGGLNEQIIEKKQKEMSKKITRTKFTSIERQRKFMDNLFHKLNLKTMEEWKIIPRAKFKQNGAKTLLNIHYKKDFINLLSTIYPNYPWNFPTNININLIKKFKSIEIQRELADKFFIKLNLNSLENWLNITPYKLKNDSYELNNILEKYYKKNMKEFLISIYPNYPWNFENLYSFLSFNSFENRKKFMDKLYIKFNLKSLDDWIQFPISKIQENGGFGLLHIYKRNMELLLLNIYPNYPWIFLNISNNNINEKQKQEKLFDDLFYHLKLINFEDWKKVSSKKLFKIIGKFLKKKNNNNNNNNDKNKNKIYIENTLKNMYPNYPWNFHSIISKNHFKSIENQRKFMDKLFIKFKLKSFDDWLNISPSKIQSNKGKKVLKIYNNEIENLYLTIYPNYPWNFELSKINSKISLKKIENQRKFIDKLYKKLKLISFDDWILISSRKWQINAYYLLQKYHHNIPSMLTKLYPNFPWDFSNFRVPKYFNLMEFKKSDIYSNEYQNIFSKSIENQRKFMDNLFIKLKLKSFDDWNKITRNKIVQLGGESLIYIYEKNILNFFPTIYPNYPWQNLSSFKIMKRNLNFLNSIENQREIMDKLFIKFNLNSLNDWVNISKYKFNLNGGKNLLFIYSRNYFKIFQSIYPNYPWELKNFRSLKYYLKSIENQREYMAELFIKFNLNSLDDWLNFQQKETKKREIEIILKKFNNDFKFLLTSIYPNYPWKFPECQLRYSFSPILKELMEKFSITQKKDWYRIPYETVRKYNLYKTLKNIYPNEQWKNLFEDEKKKNLTKRKTTKTTQRLLFSFTQKIYPSLLIFENYFHPKLIHSANFELDIFIPALQLALEYQGEQHYDDMPAAFGTVELLQSRDEEKEKLAKKLAIKIIYIPYWWDQSLTSLLSSLQSS